MKTWKLFLLALVLAAAGAVCASYGREVRWLIYVAFVLTGAGGVMAIVVGMRNHT